MIYLLKLSLAWLLFIALFEVLYQRNGRFTINRIYLLLSIAIGLILPFMQLPDGVADIFTTTHHFYNVVAPVPSIPAVLPMPSLPFTPTAGVSNMPSVVVAVVTQHPVSIFLVLKMAYGTGVLLLLFKCLYEVVAICLLLGRKSIQLMNGQKIIVTGKIHAPYSFLGFIFITELSIYTAPELEYIIRHEAAHGSRKHWLDLWIVQLVCILFWFHPLVWRYRYLLQMQHEYEADNIAANNDPYAYGHFLLQQTLLGGVPGTAHSFHFSPIKKRINMLTQKHSFKTARWKYVLLAPVLLGCSFLMARGDEHTVGNGITLKDNETSYNGNVFAWRDADSSILKSKINAEMNNPVERRMVVYSMNGDTVYQNGQLSTPARYGAKTIDYPDFVRDEFAVLRKGTADSLAYVLLYGVVIDKQGSVALYDVRFVKPLPKYLGSRNLWQPYPSLEPVLNSYMEKIRLKSPKWKPALVNGKPVNSFVTFAVQGC